MGRARIRARAFAFLSISLMVMGCNAALNNSPQPTTPSRTSITGTETIADGVNQSTISIALVDDGGNPLVGAVPLFTATDTHTVNVYGPCSPSDLNGLSTCTLSSTFAETKLLTITSPIQFTGSSVIFDPQPQSQIAIDVQPVANAVAGVAIANQPQFELHDPLGNLVTHTVSMTLSAFSDPLCTVPGTGVLTAAANPQPTIGGIVAFSGITYTKAGPLYLRASSPGLISACTSVVTVVHNVGNKLIFTTEPSLNAVAGIAYAAQPVVQLQDFWGNLVDDGPTSTPAISLSSWADAGCSVGVPGTLGADINPLVPTAGIATYSNVSHTKAVGIWLQATSPGLVSTCSTRTLVVPNVPDPGHSSIVGTGPVAANSYHFSNVTIVIQDVYGNPRPGDAVTFSATNTGNSNIYGGCPVTNIFGTTFCTLKSSNVELKTLSITSPTTKPDGTVNFIIPPAPANTTITALGPTVADAVATSAVTVVMRDISNAPVVGIAPTFTATNTGLTNGYSSCTISDGSGTSTCTMTSTKAELKTLKITMPLLMSGSTVLFVHGPGSQLAFSAFPVNGTAGVNFATQPAVMVYDQYMNFVNTGPDAAKSITIAPFTGGGCATPGLGALVTSSNPQNAAGGIATFAGVNYTKSGTFYLQASGPGVSATCSPAITVVHNSAHHLAFDQQPSASGIAGSALGLQPRVQVQDAYNNQVLTGASSTTSINLAVMDSACGGAAAGTFGISQNPLSAVSGNSQFSSVSFTTATTIRFKATGGGLIPICSNTVGITPAAASASTITGTGPVTADDLSFSTISINLADIYGNKWIGTVPLFQATNTNGNNLYGSCSSSDASGNSTCQLRSTYAELKTLQLITPFNKFGGSVLFVAGPPARLSFTTQPGSPVVAGSAIAPNSVLQVQDQYANPINGAVDSITLAPFQSSDCASVAGTSALTAAANPVSANGANGSAQFTNLRYTKTEPLYLKASAAGLQSACSSLVTVQPGSAVAGNSSFSASGPAVADGASFSTISVVLKDVYGNPLVGTVPVYIAGGSANTLGGCSAVNNAGSSSCKLYSTRAENKMVSLMTPIMLPGNLVTFNPGPAAQLVYTTQPSANAVAGQVFGVSPSVQIQDAQGNPLTTSVSAITLSQMTDGACSMVGSGILSAASNPMAANGTSGTAVFSNVSYTRSGVLYLKATLGGISACSSGVTVSAASPSSVKYQIQPPATGLMGKTIASAPSTRIYDVYGNLVPNANNSVLLSPFTNAICSAAAPGALSFSVNPVASSAGLATFSNMSYSQEGRIYLRASSAGLASDCSTPLDVLRWTPLSTTGALSARENQSAIWTGSKMILWGGRSGSTYFNTGVIYDPVADTWTALPVNGNTPSGRERHTAIWTGAEMIVWGGNDGTGWLNTGARFNVSLNTWTPLPVGAGTPSGRHRHAAVWTGAQMIVIGGADGSSIFSDGGMYTLASDSWSALQSFGMPSPRADLTAVWSGTEMLVFGGYDGTSYRSDGGHYNPGGSGTWAAIQPTGVPQGRSKHTAIWTGTKMIVWGGTNGSTPLDDGGVYTPGGGGSWTATQLTGVPPASSGHTAIWTGSTMIVWGGDNGAQINSGGVYTPGGAGSWTNTSNGINLPTARDSHTAIWATDRMLIWGGCTSGSCTGTASDGAFYLP